jgi:hypothetical protein
MSLWDVLNGATAKFGKFISITERFSFTGYTKPMGTTNTAAQDILDRRNSLIDAICEAYDQPDFKPEVKDGVLVTHCNEAAAMIAHKLGYFKLSGMNADEISAFMDKSDEWQLTEMVYVQRLANQGTLVFAVLPSTELGQPHGHICTIRPGNVKASGKWGFAPACMNVGGHNFIAGGLNDAFIPKPRLYALKTTVVIG